MFRRQIVLPSFNAVGVGQTASVDLAPGKRYLSLYVNYKTNASQATLEADIPAIRLIVNGKVQRTFSAAELNKLNALNGIAYALGTIQIHLAESWLRTWVGEEGYGWGTGDIATFKLEIDIAGTAVAPTLSGFVEIDSPLDAKNQPLGIGVIKKVKRFTRVVPGAGVMNITDLPRIDAYSRIHIFASAAIIDKVKVNVDGMDVWELTTAQMATRLLVANPKLTAQTNAYHICFDVTQQGDSVLPMKYGNGRAVSDFRVDLTTNAGGNITIITETVGQPD